MIHEEFCKNISLKNSVIIAKTLYELFSDPDKFKEFKVNMNEYKGNHSLQKFIWNTELDRSSRSLYTRNKELLDNRLADICTDSDKIRIIGTVKHSYKLTTIEVQTDVPLEYEKRTYARVKNHIYTDEVEKVSIEANTAFEIHKFNLLKVLLEPRFSGIMENARIKVPNNNFPNGIETPFDIFNKCIIQMNK